MTPAEKREKHRDYMREYREINKDRLAAVYDSKAAVLRMKRWRDANPTRSREHSRKKYWADVDASRTGARERSRRYYHADPFRAMVNTAKDRARKKGWSCDIDRAFVAQMHAEQKGRCAVTGVLFNDASQIGCHRKPFAMSLDRIDSSKGYVKGNCRLVCFAVNVAMNQWGDGVFAKLAYGLVDFDKRRFP